MKNTIEISATALALSRPPLPSNENKDTLNKEVPSAGTNQSNIEKKQQDPQGRPSDPNMDSKRLRRLMASRQYSQKYRLKQALYIMQLETEVKALQAKVAITGPRIKYSNCQNSLLRRENKSIKQKLSSCSGELMFREAQYEELKKERDMIKQSYIVNQHQYPDLFKTMPPVNYPLIMNLNLNLNLNQPR